MNRNDEILDGIPAFVEVVKREGFSAAAASLNRSPSHISKEVTRLEDRLGIRLLNRTTRSVTLTDDGRAYFDRCKAIMDLARDAEAAASGQANTPKGRLRVTAPLSYSLSHLNDIFPRFLAEQPDILLDIELNDRRVDVVAEGFDVALRIGDLPDSTLVAKKLGAFRGMVIATPEYWDRAGRPEHPSELSNHPCFGYSNMKMPDRWHFPDGQGGVIDVKIPLAALCNSGELSREFVLAGHGVARLPDFACGKHVESGELEVVLTEYERDPIPLWAVYPHRAHLSAKVRSFIGFLERELRDFA